MSILRRRPRKRHANTTTVSTAVRRVLLAIVAITLIPALGLVIGTVGSELAHRAAAEEAADQYPVGDPTRCHVRALDTAVDRLPDLGIDWRWAELDTRNALGSALLRSRIVLIDPEITCADVASVAYHEWTHIAQVVYYGGTTTPDGTVVSDLVDGNTGRPYQVPIQELVADCATLLLTDEYGDDLGPRAYLQMTGGCPPDLLAMAREIVTNAGVKLTLGTVSALGSVGAGVA